MTGGAKVLRESDLNSEVGLVVGTRPGIVMFAPIVHELRRRDIPFFVIHTGQHYSPNMDAQFFSDLELPDPHYRIANTAERTTHGAQTAHMLESIEQILFERRPTLVLVGGDANTNLAGALAARKLRIAVGHVEAGERSFDWRMPEEHNRRIIDHISDLLFVTDANAEKNLTRESVCGRIIHSGNPIVDASQRHLSLALNREGLLKALNLVPDSYAILTLHREENVDDYDCLRSTLMGVSQAVSSLELPLMFFIHPRTRKRLQEFGLAEWAEQLPGFALQEPAGYLDFLAIVANARLVFTDSGGVQQEACIHRVPAITLRDNTEWTQTLDVGANRLAGSDPVTIVAAARAAYEAERQWSLPFGDGDAAERIVNCVVEFLAHDITHGA